VRAVGAQVASARSATPAAPTGTAPTCTLRGAGHNGKWPEKTRASSSSSSQAGSSPIPPPARRRDAGRPRSSAEPGARGPSACFAAGATARRSHLPPFPLSPSEPLPGVPASSRRASARSEASEEIEGRRLHVDIGDRGHIVGRIALEGEGSGARVPGRVFPKGRRPLGRPQRPSSRERSLSKGREDGRRKRQRPERRSPGRSPCSRNRQRDRRPPRTSASSRGCGQGGAHHDSTRRGGASRTPTFTRVTAPVEGGGPDGRSLDDIMPEALRPHAPPGCRPCSASSSSTCKLIVGKIAHGHHRRDCAPARAKSSPRHPAQPTSTPCPAAASRRHRQRLPRPRRGDSEWMGRTHKFLGFHRCIVQTDRPPRAARWPNRSDIHLRTRQRVSASTTCAPT
jgi:hypothetical protein